MSVFMHQLENCMTNVNNLPSLPAGTRLSRFWLIERAFSEMHLWDLCQEELKSAQGDDLSLHSDIAHRAFHSMHDLIRLIMGQDEALGFWTWMES
jgi:hypothetical protein